MPTYVAKVTRSLRRVGVTPIVLVLGLLLVGEARAQLLSGQTRAVGGISIDPNGVLSNAETEWVGKLRALRLAAMDRLPDDLNQASPLRKVSLRGLEAALQKQLAGGKPISDTLQHLAGLQQIRYVFVYPERQDIVLVGPAEGWKVDARGNVVGVTSGRPVLTLDDLVVALRSARAASQGGISCSIDPTADGLSRLQAYAKRLRTIGPNPEATVAGIRQTLGPQKISVAGVPAGSHFARVLVAADYRMKRLAMKFEPAPIRGLPSFLDMVPATGRGLENLLPRWWLTAEYRPVLRDPSGLAWELGGAAVKAMTEEDFLTADGRREHTGRASPVAQKWADTMTAKYDELAVADPIFGQLRNCMELAVVAALVAKENLPEKAGYSLPVLLDPQRVGVVEFPAPRQVDTQASVVKRGKTWVISASGGVQFQSWNALEKAQEKQSLRDARAKALGNSDAWWWN
jgi:hypothetical protein